MANEQGRMYVSGNLEQPDQSIVRAKEANETKPAVALVGAIFLA
jgi:hypothetical protein